MPAKKPASQVAYNLQVIRRRDLILVANGHARRLQQILQGSNERLAGLLSGVSEPSRLRDPQRLRHLFEALDARLESFYSTLSAEQAAYLAVLVAAELEHQERTLQRLYSMVGARVKKVAPGSALAHVKRTPAVGRKPAEWVRDLTIGDRTRVRTAIVSAAQRGATSAELRRAVVGTATRAYADGSRAATRNALEALSQTMTAHAGAQAASTAWEANKITHVRWVATLDNKTSLTCQVLDGEVFPIDDGPRPPAHPNCRSAITPIIPGLRALDPGKFSAQASIDFNGKPPQVLTYRDWFAERSPEFQREVLGPTRFELYRNDALDLGAFVSEGGQVRTIEELRRRFPSAFAEAERLRED